MGFADRREQGHGPPYTGRRGMGAHHAKTCAVSATKKGPIAADPVRKEDVDSGPRSSDERGRCRAGQPWSRKTKLEVIVSPLSLKYNLSEQGVLIVDQERHRRVSSLRRDLGMIRIYPSLSSNEIKISRFSTANSLFGWTSLHF
ncbi:hypothetical protein KC333_g83 [Hortaea werneckii]|nr:hypothetical protein KC333_g83 [Hortaea werneckii]